MDNFSSEFSNRLRYARIEKGLTLEQLSSSLQIPLRSYQRYESGEIQPPYKKLVKIADALDVSLDYLFSRDDYLRSIGVSFDSPKTYPPRHPNKK